MTFGTFETKFVSLECLQCRTVKVKSVKKARFYTIVHLYPPLLKITATEGYSHS